MGGGDYSYSLNYGYSQASKRSVLNGIVHCGSIDEKCKESTSFNYESQSTHYQANVIKQSLGGGQYGQYSHHIGDLDGDGLDDLIWMYKGSAGAYASTSLAQGDGMFFPASAKMKIAPGQYQEYSRHTGDFDGDGRTDLLWNYYGSAGLYVTTSLGAGDGTFLPASSKMKVGSGNHQEYTRQTSDIDGDGRTDLLWIYKGSSGLYISTALSNGDGSFRSVEIKRNLGSGNYRDYGHHTGDINGDGNIDIVWIYIGSAGIYYSSSLGNGDGTFQLATTKLAVKTSSWACGEGCTVELNDLNGDGNEDIFIGTSATFGLYAATAISTGDGKFNKVNITKVSGINHRPYLDEDSKKYYWSGLSGDFNGDGITDVMWANSSTSGLFVTTAVGLGNGEFEIKDTKKIISTESYGGFDYKRLSGDFNGDGLTDLLWSFQGNSGLFAATSLANYESLFSIEKLNGVIEGLGREIEINYEAIHSSDKYIASQKFDYPIQDSTDPRHVVTQYSMSNGVGGSNSYSYLYEGVKTNRRGRGFLGFEKITETDDQTNINRSVYYKQQTISGYQNVENDFWINGRVDKKVTSYNGLDFEVVDNEWDIRLSDKNRPFPYKTSITTKKKEVSNGVVNTDTTTLNTKVTPYGLIENSTTTSHNFGTTEEIVNKPCANNVSTWDVGKVCMMSATKTSSTLTGGSNVRSEIIKTKYEYSPKGKLEKKISFWDTNVALTEDYQYDVYGNIWKHTVSGKDGTAMGNITARTNRTDYVFSATELTVTTTHEQDVRHSETRVFDRKTGLQKSVTDANNLTVSWLYDGFGRKSKEIRPGPDRNETNWKYFSCDINAHQRDPLCNNVNESYYIRITHTGQPTEIYYNDILDRTIRTELSGPNGTTISQNIEFNALGLIEKESNNYLNSATHWTRNIYDEIGRVKKILLPGNIDVNNPDIEYSYPGFEAGYGIKNVITTHRKGDNSSTLVEVKYLDGQGSLLSARDADYNTINYSYTPFSLLETVTDSQLNVVNYQYDPAGNKIVDDDPDMGKWTYRYDALGLLRESADSKNQRVTVNYDTLDRLVTRTDHTSSETSIWKYDSAVGKGIGQLHSISRAADGYVETYRYDNLGRLSQTSITLDGSVYHINNGYDASSRLTSTTYPSSGAQGRFVKTNVYDSNGYLTNIKNSNGLNYWTRVSTNENFRVTWAKLGNGLNAFSSYNPSSGLPQTIKTGFSTNNIQNLEYGFDNLGNLEFREDYNLKDLLGRTSATSTGIREKFTYDQLNRLTNTTVAGTAAKQYDYDSIGNLTYSSELGVYTYGQNGAGPHAVTTVDGGTLTYDSNGGMLQGRGRTIAYSSFHKPISISQAGVTSTFKYGPERDRYKKVVSASSGNSTTYYIGTLFEKVQKGDVTEYKNYIYAGDAVIASYTVTETSSSSTHKEHYLHHDHQGSVVAITDESGKIKERYSYDVYGKRITSAKWNDGTIASLISNVSTRGYTGHETLEEHQLVHMNGRVYDPELARFLSADPLVKYPESTQGWNRYSYVDNNPLSRIDPSGYGWSKIRGIVKVIVGVIAIAVDSVCSCTGTALSQIGLALIGSGADEINGKEKDENSDEGFYIGTSADDQGNVTVSISYGQWNIGSPEQGLINGIPLAGMSWNNNHSSAVDTRPRTGTSNIAPAVYAAVEVTPYLIPIAAQLARSIGTRFLSMIGAGAGGGKAAKYAVDDFSEVAGKISQKQMRHIGGRKEYRGGGFLKSVDDAQHVLDAYRSGSTTIIGKSKQGFPIVRHEGVTGTNVNVGAGVSNQSTNVFMIKGTKSPSVVPMSPTWTPLL